MNEHDTAQILKWGLIGIGGYLLYKTFIATKNVVVNAQQAAGSSLADAAQFILGNGIAQPGEVYTVTMPDNSVQTVAYGDLPNAAAGLPPATTGMQIGTGNYILDSFSQGASGGG